jgi:hypothetical protein
MGLVSRRLAKYAHDIEVTLPLLEAIADGLAKRDLAPVQLELQRGSLLAPHEGTIPNDVRHNDALIARWSRGVDAGLTAPGPGDRAVRACTGLIRDVAGASIGARAPVRKEIS